MELDCIIHRIHPVEQIGENFRKRELNVRIKDKYNRLQYLRFFLTQEKESLIEGYKVGDGVKLYFELIGREKDINNEKKIYDSKEIYQIEPLDKVADTSDNDYMESCYLKPGEKDIELDF